MANPLILMVGQGGIELSILGFLVTVTHTQGRQGHLQNDVHDAS
jgi:hypothetical protein